MKENHKSLISTASKLVLSQKKFGYRSTILSKLSKIGFPIVEGFFISSEIMKQIEIGKKTLQIPSKFLECGPFCLRSSTKRKEFAGLEPFLFLGLNKDKIEELSYKYGQKKLNQIYLSFIKNFGIRVFDLEVDFFENVKVNDESKIIRKNRLELLNFFCKTFEIFIDFQSIRDNNE